MVHGSKNIDLMLDSPRPYFDKIGLGFEKKEGEKSSRDSQSKISLCICYFKKGHSFEICFSKRKEKRQKAKNLKEKTNPKRPKKIWVPKVKNVSDAGVS